jgi:transcription antitermination protein NusB
MSARRIARELAVIVFPQLPKDKSKLEKSEVTLLVARAVQMLSDYAKQCLADADAFITRAGQTLQDIELEHPDNAASTEELLAVPLTTANLREQVTLLDRAVHLISEALDLPEVVLQAGGATVELACKNCGKGGQHTFARVESTETIEYLTRLITTYLENREAIDQFIRDVRAKWKVERMVSIDRDIVRLACAEAFFMSDIPIAVSINEAVELTHRFADETAARFINGILRDLAVQAKNYRRTGRFAPLEDDALDISSPSQPR